MDDGINRCNRCEINWPPTADYDKCPYCSQSTSRRHFDVMTHTYDEAEAIRKQATFERKYEKRRKEESERINRQFEEITKDQFDDFKELDSLWPA